MTISSLRFDSCVKNVLKRGYAGSDEYGGFANAVLECVFSIPHDERGMVDRMTYSHAFETEGGMLLRVAQVHVKRERGPYFFYIFAETHVLALQEWRVIGRSPFMRGHIRMPTFEEVHWF